MCIINIKQDSKFASFFSFKEMDGRIVDSLVQSQILSAGYEKIYSELTPRIGLCIRPLYVTNMK